MLQNQNISYIVRPDRIESFGFHVVGIDKSVDATSLTLKASTNQAKFITRGKLLASHKIT